MKKKPAKKKAKKKIEKKPPTLKEQAKDLLDVMQRFGSLRDWAEIIGRSHETLRKDLKSDGGYEFTRTRAIVYATVRMVGRNLVKSTYGEKS